jgi:hypothetical protein
MKKYSLVLAIFLMLSAAPALAAGKTTTTSSKATWNPLAPVDYTLITWAQAPGIASYFKPPSDNGAIDFLTRIYLPKNQINFLVSPTPPVSPAAAKSNTEASGLDAQATVGAGAPADISSFPNLTFARIGAEAAKAIDPSIKFIWDAAFFNMKPLASDLSMAVKYTTSSTTTISSGSRSASDMALPRRMLIINNQTGKAEIENFDSSIFTDPESGDQALEGFSPAVVKTDSSSPAASRLFLGVSTDGEELEVYCSQLATVQEASDALTAAGVSIDHQLEADGGASAACGYNLPGQFFVEPTRSLPLLMGAKTIFARGKITASTANVRSGPSTKFSIVSKLSKGTTVLAFGELNGWYRIGDGEWVIKSLVK